MARSLSINEIGIFVDKSEINSGYRQEKSPNGFDIDILKSGLQKYIRRGETEKALWCAAELDLFYFIEGGERIRTNLIHRLMVIFLEDVGPGHIAMWPIINEKVKSFLSLRKEQKRNVGLFKSYIKKEMQIITDITSLLSESTHSRVLSHYNTAIVIANDRDTHGYLRKLAKKYYPDINKVYRELDTEVEEGLSIDVEYELQEGESGIENEVKNFLGSLEKGSDTAVYWSYKIATAEIESKRNRHKNDGIYLVLYLIEQYVKQKIEKKLRKQLLKYVGIAREWANELKIKERFLIYLVLVVSILHIDEIDWEELTEEEIDTISWKEVYAVNVFDPPIDIDDYVIDIHTKKGRSKSKIDFVNSGSLVNNEYTFNIPPYHELYDAFKIIETIGYKSYLKTLDNEESSVSHGDEESGNSSDVERKPVKKTKSSRRKKSSKKIEKKSSKKTSNKKDSLVHENDILDFTIRAQLICGKARPCTYFAVDKETGKNVFVKGPYIDSEDARYPFILAKLKRKYFEDLYGIESRLETFVPEVFENMPFGSRLKVKKNTEYTFLITENLCELEEFPSVVKESKLWPETEVVDWSQVETCKTPDIKYLYKNDKKAFRLFILNILFRYLFGVPDYACRNFIYRPHVKGKGRIVSIDEEGWNRIDDFQRSIVKLGKKNIPPIKKYIDTYYEEQFMNTLAEWLSTFEKHELKIKKLLDDNAMLKKLRKRLNDIQEKDFLLNLFP